MYLDRSRCRRASHKGRRKRAYRVAGRQAEPRIVDTLNIFLRAVDERDVSSILAMERLRAEMLRRVRLVTGDEAVKAVLIAEFLLR